MKVHWLEEDNVERTLLILDKLTHLLVSWVERGLVEQETIYGIALLNEPWGVDQNVWEEVRDNFYPKGYEVCDEWRETLQVKSVPCRL